MTNEQLSTIANLSLRGALLSDEAISSKHLSLPAPPPPRKFSFSFGKSSPGQYTFEEGLLVMHRSEKRYFVYILTNSGNTVLYTGVTSNLLFRLYQHRVKQGSRFTARYNLWKLVYFEAYDDPYNAISREKQIKAGSRAKKLALIRAMNPSWRDLSADF